MPQPLQPDVKRTLVILAAGVGSRYGGLKQLAPVGPSGESLLEYSVFDALDSGISQVVLVVRPETEKLFRARFDGSMARRVSLIYAHQRLDDLPNGWAPPLGRKKPWGTVHAVLTAAQAVDGPLVVVNADDYYGWDAYRRLTVELESRAAGGPMPSTGIPSAVVGFEVGQTLSPAGPVSRALCRTDSNGRLLGIQEIQRIWRDGDRILYRRPEGDERTFRGDELVSMNMWQLSEELVALLRGRFEVFLHRFGQELDSECLLPDEIQGAMAESGAEIRTVRGAGPWCGLTFADDVERARGILADLVEAGRYPGDLWAD